MRGEEPEPVGSRLHEMELQSRVPAASQPERDLRVGPLERLVPAVVEDPNLAGAVVPLRDRALEGAVLERVDLGLNGEALVAFRDRKAARDGPAREPGLALEPPVVVEPRRAVLVGAER